MTETFGERLRRLRLARGKSQLELADDTGVHIRSVYEWESGLVHPHPRSMRRLAEYFGIPVDTLRTGIAPPEKTGRIVDLQRALNAAFVRGASKTELQRIWNSVL